jgi:hypothetical protein
MEETMSALTYHLKQLGTEVRQSFVFTKTPSAVTSKSLVLFGRDELALIQLLILRTKYLDSVLPCLETKDAIACLLEAENSFNQLSETVLRRAAVGYEVYEKALGHVYFIYGPPESAVRTIIFVCRSGEAVTYEQEWPGVQSQEVMRMLIARLKYLSLYLNDGSINETIDWIRLAFYHYELRAWRRKEEAVNRLDAPHEDSERHRPWRTEADGAPFSQEYIESRGVGPDGHIIF